MQDFAHTQPPLHPEDEFLMMMTRSNTRGGKILKDTCTGLLLLSNLALQKLFQTISGGTLAEKELQKESLRHSPKETRERRPKQLVLLA